MSFKRNTAFLLAIAFFAASLFAAVPVRAAATYYVKTDGNNGLSGLDWTNAWQTISYAVTTAGVGDTIIVKAGTYAENVAIGKRLTLQSESKWGAIIKPATVASNAVYISADGVTVDGFDIDGTTVCKNGIYGWETSGLTIINNKIHGAINSWDGCGILLISWGNTGTVYNNYVAGNEVYNTGRMGIMIMDHDVNWPGLYTVTSGNTITGNTVHDVWKMATAWGDGGGGIQINVGKNCAITKNYVYSVQDGQRGIYMFGSAAGNTISCNTVANNPIGIQLWISGYQTPAWINWGSETPTSPQLRNNNIYGNTLYGAISTNTETPIISMDAINNWWGSITGPTHSSNPAGKGDKVTDNVLFVPFRQYYSTCAPGPYQMGDYPVGGEWIPINSVQLVAPWIILVLIALASVAAGTHRLIKKHL